VDFLCAPLCYHHAYTFHLPKFEQTTIKLLVEMILPHHHQGFLQIVQTTLSPFISLAFFYVLKKVAKEDLRASQQWRIRNVQKKATIVIHAAIMFVLLHYWQ
jgi:hypothetical protein